jgi:hypothetical protein
MMETAHRNSPRAIIPAKESPDPSGSSYRETLLGAVRNLPADRHLPT